MVYSSVVNMSPIVTMATTTDEKALLSFLTSSISYSSLAERCSKRTSISCLGS